MKTFIKQNWFKLGVLFVLLFVALAFVFYRQPANTSNVESDAAGTSSTKGAPEIKQFISDLPNGDVDPQKCKELVSDKQTELDYSLNSAQAHGPWASLVDSKYIYSKKLCLAYISNHSGGTYPNISSTYQIFDLGSNEIFAEYDEKGAVNKDGSVDDEQLFLWGKEQNKPFLSITSLWYTVTLQF